jgi:hypothetical protein
MEIVAFGNNEHAVGAHRHAVGNEHDRHRRMSRQDLVQQGRQLPHMVHDDDRHAHVGGELRQQPHIRIKATGRSADADDGKAFCESGAVHAGSKATRSGCTSAIGWARLKAPIAV